MGITFLTKEPEPRLREITPPTSSLSSAFFTVILLTEYRSQSSSIVGSCSLGV